MRPTGADPYDFEAHARSVQALFESPVRVLVRHELWAVRGDGRVQEAVIMDHAAGVEKVLAVDDVLICIGLKPNLGPIQHWGFLLDGRHVLVNPRLETNLPGVYAAGDIAFQEGVENRTPWNGSAWR